MVSLQSVNTTIAIKILIPSVCVEIETHLLAQLPQLHLEEYWSAEHAPLVNITCGVFVNLDIRCSIRHWILLHPKVKEEEEPLFQW